MNSTTRTRIGLATGGIVIAACIIGLAFNFIPSLSERSLVNPLDKSDASLTLHYRITEATGDLFSVSPRAVRRPEDPQLLAEHNVFYDADGFRMSETRADHYPIIALGDSYTEAPMVVLPWPDALARELEIPVRNLGFRAYGPVEYQNIMNDYGQNEDQEWVLMAFFEGNDLRNIFSSINNPDPEFYDRLGMITPKTQPNQATSTPGPPPTLRPQDQNQEFFYPTPLVFASYYYEVAFYDYYLWWLNGEKEVYLQSREMAGFRDILKSIKEASSDANLLVIYLPSKEHIYAPYMVESWWVLTAAHETILDEDGWLSTAPITTDLEGLVANFPNQRDAIQEVVLEQGISFLDLTPAFQEAALSEELLYFKYDTHWNQAGHDLAGKVIADYIRSFDE